MKNIWMMAPSCLPLADDYDMVIHLDADAVVTGPLDEMFNSTADVIGVRNNTSKNTAGAHRGITISHSPPFGDGNPIPMQQFINAGMVGVNKKEFWYDWHNLNEQVAKTGMSDEQDTLNNLFHWKKYNSEVIDVTNGKCKVKLNSGGEIFANPITVKSKGEKTTVSLRPERALINPDEKMDNSHKGKIEEVIYHGDHTRVRLNLLGNNEFILKVPNSSANLDIKLGNEINIGWDSADARALDPK